MGQLRLIEERVQHLQRDRQTDRWTDRQIQRETGRVRWDLNTRIPEQGDSMTCKRDSRELQRRDNHTWKHGQVQKDTNRMRRVQDMERMQIDR